MERSPGRDPVDRPVVRVLVVDDHRLVRAGLRSLLEATDDLQVAGEAEDGDEALAACRALDPDVVLMDLSMPGMDGIEATRRLVAASSRAQVLVLTSFGDGSRMRQALDAGAVGYLLKDAEPQDLLRGIREVAGGRSPLDPRAVRAMLDSRPQPDGHELTRREAEVLQLLTRGRSNREIARALSISESTVKVHVGHILQRIGVPDRAAAAVWAERHARPSSTATASRRG